MVPSERPAGSPTGTTAPRSPSEPPDVADRTVVAVRGPGRRVLRRAGAGLMGAVGIGTLGSGRVQRGGDGLGGLRAQPGHLPQDLLGGLLGRLGARRVEGLVESGCDLGRVVGAGSLATGRSWDRGRCRAATPRARPRRTTERLRGAGPRVAPSLVSSTGRRPPPGPSPAGRRSGSGRGTGRRRRRPRRTRPPAPTIRTCRHRRRPCAARRAPSRHRTRHRRTTQGRLHPPSIAPEGSPGPQRAGPRRPAHPRGPGRRSGNQHRTHRARGGRGAPRPATPAPAATSAGHCSALRVIASRGSRSTRCTVWSGDGTSCSIARHSSSCAEASSRLSVSVAGAKPCSSGASSSAASKSKLASENRSSSNRSAAGPPAGARGRPRRPVRCPRRAQRSPDPPRRSGDRSWRTQRAARVRRSGRTCRSFLEVPRPFLQRCST